MRNIDKHEVIRLLTIAFNRGYATGHHDTMEGGYVDVHNSDIERYHESEALDVFQEFMGDDE